MDGIHDWSIESSVSLIDCRTHRARPLADMPRAVAGSVAEAIDDKVYVIGGTDGHSPSRTVMVFDTKTEVWEVKTGPDWERGWRKGVEQCGYGREDIHEDLLQ